MPQSLSVGTAFIRIVPRWRVSVDPRTFDGMIQKLSASLSRRKVVGGSVGAAVLTTAGLIESTLARGKKNKKNQVQAEACVPTGKKCPAKGPRRRRGRNRKTLGCNRCCQDAVVTVTNGKGETVTRCGCRPDGADCGGRGRANCCSGVCDGAGKCAASAPVTEALSEEGSGTLTSTCSSSPTESCTDQVVGTIQGTPVDGTFDGTFTRTNFVPASGSGYTADVTGSITLLETSTGDTLSVTIVGEVTGEGYPPPSGAFTSTGTYTITGGTGRFNAASGTGTATSSGTDSGSTGTLDSLTLTGTITLL